MNTEPTNIFLISMSCLIAIMYFLLYLMNRKQKLEKKRYERLKARNDILPAFRQKVLYIYGEEAYDQLKSYDTMLYSNKELKTKEWVEPDKIFNLN